MTVQELIAVLLRDRIPLRLNAERRLVLAPGWDFAKLPPNVQEGLKEHRKDLETELVLGGPSAARLMQLVCGECHPEVKPLGRTWANKDETFFCPKCQWGTGHFPRVEEQRLREMRGLKGA